MWSSEPAKDKEANYEVQMFEKCLYQVSDGSDGRPGFRSTMDTAQVSALEDSLQSVEDGGMLTTDEDGEATGGGGDGF